MPCFTANGAAGRSGPVRHWRNESRMRYDLPVGSSDTQNFKLVLCYDGSRFRGWQRGNGRTVQSTLEEALRRALPAAAGSAAGGGLIVSAHGSGRTDAGVHAEGQVASVTLPASVDPGLLFEAVNRELPFDLAVRSVETVPERFHARYLAVAKTYRYRIDDGPCGNPLLRRFAWRVTKTLNLDRIGAASRVLIGTHDFSAFTAERGKANTTRTIYSIHFDRSELFGSRPLDIFVRGTGFLWKQVRIVTSALVAVGQAERDEAWLESVLASGDRSLAPPAAPARGLTLLSVEFREPVPRS